ncbi:hypothetical protein ACMUMK_17800 [Paraglaciecola sp. 2405UD69-4]
MSTGSHISDERRAKYRNIDTRELATLTDLEKLQLTYIFRHGLIAEDQQEFYKDIQSDETVDTLTTYYSDTYLDTTVDTARELVTYTNVWDLTNLKTGVLASIAGGLLKGVVTDISHRYKVFGGLYVVDEYYNSLDVSTATNELRLKTLNAIEDTLEKMDYRIHACIQYCSDNDMMTKGYRTYEARLNHDINNTFDYTPNSLFIMISLPELKELDNKDEGLLIGKPVKYHVKANEQWLVSLYEIDKSSYKDNELRVSADKWGILVPKKRISSMGNAYNEYFHTSISKEIPGYYYYSFSLLDKTAVWMGETYEATGYYIDKTIIKGKVIKSDSYSKHKSDMIVMK